LSERRADWRSQADADASYGEGFGGAEAGWIFLPHLRQMVKIGRKTRVVFGQYPGSFRAPHALWHIEQRSGSTSISPLLLRMIWD